MTRRSHKQSVPNFQMTNHPNESLPYNQNSDPESRSSVAEQKSLVPSYHTKLLQFKRAFKDTDVDTDRLLVDYSCAFYNNGLLTQGRMFITEDWICFHSKLIYEVKLMMDVRKIISITKEKTAKLIPNAIQFICAQSAECTKISASKEVRYFFTSFAARERTFAILHKIWMNGQTHKSLLTSTDFQCMSMDEIVRQVREMYGDHSAEAFLDAAQGQELSSEIRIPPFHSSSPNQPTNPGTPNTELSHPNSTNQYMPRRSSWIDRDHIAYPVTELPMNFGKLEMNLSDISPIEQNSLSDGLSNTNSHEKSNNRNQSPSTGRGLLTTSIEPVSSSSIADLSSNKKFPPSEDEQSSFGSRHSKHRTKEARTKMIQQEKMDQDESDTTENSDYQSAMKPKGLTSQQPQWHPEAACDHNHEGRLFIDAEYPISIDAMFKCLFTDCQFNRDFLEIRATTDFNSEDWTHLPWIKTDRNSTLDLNEDNHSATRNINYVVALKQKVGPRSCLTIEKQIVRKSLSIPQRRYVVDSRINNENVPLCTSFHVECRYCLLSINRHTTRLRVHSSLIYDEKVFFAVKNIIESTWRTNTAESFNDLADLLRQRSCRLTRSEQLSGGHLIKPPSSGQKSKLRNKSISSDLTISPKLRGSRESPSVNRKTINEMRLIDSCYQPKLFQVPRSDRDWLIIISISVLLCLCLSMLYSRFLQLEEMATQFNSASQYAGGGPACSVGLAALSPSERKNLELAAEIQKIRQVLTSLSEVLQNMKGAFNSIETQLQAISESMSHHNVSLSESNEG